MIGDDGYWDDGTWEPGSELLKRLDDSQHLFIMYIIIDLCICEFSWEETQWV